MTIDEEEEYRPTKYGTKKVTKTDHNSIIMKLKVNKMANEKAVPYYNTRCEIGQAKFEEEMQNVQLENLFNDVDKINEDYGTLMNIWNDVLSKSFKKVRRSKSNLRGVDHDIKQLMSEERSVKKEWQDGKVKEEKLTELRTHISDRIAENIEKIMEDKIEKLKVAKCPQAEVFKIRRNAMKQDNLDFPLKDKNGNIRVTKQGLDEVISSHFGKVFRQNPVKDGWEEYWEYVAGIYQFISSEETACLAD